MNIAQWEKIFTDCLPAPFPANAPMQLAQYHALLCEWNQHMNLMGNTDFADALLRHYADSYAPLSLCSLWEGVTQVIDVGTGAGFPGVVLAILRPEWTITLLDSQKKRLIFLETVARECGLSNVRFVHARAEDAGSSALYREKFDIAIARAVAPLPVLCELLLPFVHLQGRMICLKGPSGTQEIQEAYNASQLLGGGELTQYPVTLPTGTPWERMIITCNKIKNTETRYPRKAGIPSKKPL